MNFTMFLLIFILFLCTRMLTEMKNIKLKYQGHTLLSVTVPPSWASPTAGSSGQHVSPKHR